MLAGTRSPASALSPRRTEGPDRATPAAHGTAQYGTPNTLPSQAAG
jgi:hypothetical protein